MTLRPMLESQSINKRLCLCDIVPFMVHIPAYSAECPEAFNGQLQPTFVNGNAPASIPIAVFVVARCIALPYLACTDFCIVLFPL